MVGRKAELELAVREGALGRDVHEFLDQVAEPEVLELDLSKQIVAKPRQQVEGDRRHRQKALNGFRTAGAEMSNLQAMLGCFNQSLHTLTAVVGGENLFGIRLGGQKMGVEMRIRPAVLAAGHQLGQDDAQGMTAV